MEAVLAQRLVKAAGQLEGEAVGDPLMVAALQNRLGQSLVSLGHPQPAVELFEKARATRAAHLGADHPNTLVSMNNLADGYRAAGKLDLALPLWEETLKLEKAKLGTDHPDTLTSMGSLGKAYCDAKQGEKALPILKEYVARQRKRFPKGDPRFALLLVQVSLGPEEVRRGGAAFAQELRGDATSSLGGLGRRPADRRCFPRRRFGAGC